MRLNTYILAAAVLIVASCTSSNEPASTTTSSTAAPPPSTTTTAPASTTTSPSSTTTTTPQEAPVFPEYRITERIVSPETGDTVVLLLDPDSYTSLSDLDIYEVIADAVDRFPPIFEAHVVDSQEAASAVLIEEPDADQAATLAAHYFARLEDGFRIVYVGDFEAVEDAVLGS